MQGLVECEQYNVYYTPLYANNPQNIKTCGGGEGARDPYVVQCINIYIWLKMTEPNIKTGAHEGVQGLAGRGQYNVHYTPMYANTPV